MDRRHPARLIRHAAQRTCRRSMRTATAALGTTMSRPSSLAGSHRVSLPISSQGAAKDCALSLTWSGRAAERMPAFLSDSIVRGLSGDFQKTPLSQTSSVGATWPFATVFAKVGNPYPQQPFYYAGGPSVWDEGEHFCGPQG